MRPKVQRLTEHPGVGRRESVEHSPPIEPVFLPLYAAASQMGISVKSLQALIANGTIFAIPVGVTGKYCKVPVGEITKWREGRYGQTQPSHGLRHIEGGAG